MLRTDHQIDLVIGDSVDLGAQLLYATGKIAYSVSRPPAEKRPRIVGNALDAKTHAGEISLAPQEGHLSGILCCSRNDGNAGDRFFMLDKIGGAWRAGDAKPQARHKVSGA